MKISYILVVVSVVVSAIGLFYPIHHVTLTTYFEKGGTWIQEYYAEYDGIYAPFHIDDDLISANNISYWQFQHDKNFNDPIFSNLGLVWVSMILLSMLFSIIAITAGRKHNYYQRAIGLSAACIVIPIVLFVLSYGNMLSVVHGVPFYESGVKTNGVQFNSSPDYGLFLAIASIIILLFAYLSYDDKKVKT
jgi:hypothetical protein